jgi:hypothetical protein
MYFLVGLLGIGFAANARIRPPETARPTVASSPNPETPATVDAPLPHMRLALYWIVVVVPMAWAVMQVGTKSLALFR